MEAASNFLRAMFGDVPEGHVLIWLVPGKTSEWLHLSAIETDLPRISKIIEAKRLSHDLYFGLGVRPRDFGMFARGGSDDVVGIVGVWADLDIAGPTHKKKHLPPSIGEVMDFLTTLPLPPTIVNFTGGGVHAFWLFKEPWIFQNNAERLAARLFVERWQKTLVTRAAARNWEIDATHDLARVFRLPGTRNLKYGDADNPVFVETILHDDTRRADPSEFEPYLIDLERYGGSMPSVDPTTVDATFDDLETVKARFNFAKRDKLYDADHKVELTWKRLRKDFANDSSPSAYDFALINAFLRVGWSDQEIVDGLMLCRSEHHEDPKFNRPDYYAYTIAKAKATQTGDPVLAVARREIQEGLPISDPLGKLNSLFKFDPEVIQITGIFKQDGRKPTYTIKTSKGDVVGLSASALQRPAEMNLAMIEQLNVAIPLTAKFKGDWDSVVLMIIMQAIRDEQGFSEETTILGSVTQWLQDYLINHPPVVSVAEAVRQRTPFIAHAAIHVASLHLRPWLNKEFSEDLSQQMLLVHLRAYGAEQVRLNVAALHGPANRTVWKLPSNAWTKGVVDGILYEHLEKHGALPPSALIDGYEINPPSPIPTEITHQGTFGIIDLTPKSDGWDTLVAAENESMSLPSDGSSATL